MSRLSDSDSDSDPGSFSTNGLGSRVGHLPLKKRHTQDSDFRAEDADVKPWATVPPKKRKGIAESDSPDPDDVSPKKRKPFGAASGSPVSAETARQSKFDPARLLANMGHKEGKGLGKHGQGIVEPVQASQQKGRRGFGLHLDHFEPDEALEWEAEEATAHETFTWIPTSADTHTMPSLEEMRSWMRIGPKKLDISGETEFVSPETLNGVLECKSVFDELEEEEMRRARTRSNPYETIRGVIFQNRAAMKMANMDAVFDFMFTEPKDGEGKPVVKANELLYFADICAGPGGFSEYVLWRRKWHCKGFGLTLKEGANDFKLEEFYAAPGECFEPHYGVGGIDGDGDIYRTDNIEAFRKFIMDSTDGQGVHFVMADGGFSVDGQENLQEVLSKRLYLCQFLCALSVLRPGGHFVCKLFDVFTPFSVGLIYLMYKAFERTTVFKPVTSRPANSERYIVCCGLIADNGSALRSYFLDVNATLQRLGFGLLGSTQDVLEVVPLDVLHADATFADWLRASNEQLGELQALHLRKIQAFSRNPNLYERRQAQLRQECLAAWRVPDSMRVAPDKVDPASRFQQLVGTRDEETDFFRSAADTLPTVEQLKAKLKSVFDYRCIVSGCPPAGEEYRLCYVLGLGKTHNFVWDVGRGSDKSGRWQKLEQPVIELPRDTLLQAEIVQEVRGEGKAQRKSLALHITDVLLLCGEDMRQRNYNLRMECARLFARAITKASRPDLGTIRAKTVYKVEQVGQLFEHIELRQMKGGRPDHARSCYVDPGTGGSGSVGSSASCCYLPRGLFFVPTVRHPWTLAYSRTHARKYFYNLDNRSQTYDTPKDSIASTRDSARGRLFVPWESLTENDRLSSAATDLLQYVQSKAGCT